MRISATLIESFRRWIDQEDGELADRMEQDLQASIRGEFTPTPAMELGKAYHAIIEDPRKMLDGCYSAPGFPDYRFEASAVENLLDRITPGLHEVKTTKELLIPGAGVVTLVTKCDHIAGSQISEFKTTLSSFDSEKYLNSYQWRVMALLFEASLITYHVACLKDEGDKYILKSLESLNVFPYPQMESDVRALIQDFCSYVKAKGLEGYLIPRYPVQAGARL